MRCASHLLHAAVFYFDISVTHSERFRCAHSIYGCGTAGTERFRERLDHRGDRIQRSSNGHTIHQDIGCARILDGHKSHALVAPLPHVELQKRIDNTDPYELTIRGGLNTEILRRQLQIAHLDALQLVLHTH